MNLKLWSNQEWVEQHKLRVSDRNKQLHAEGRMKPPPNTLGYKHSEETKARLSALKQGKHQGTSNPSAGKPWVYHPELKQCKKIQAEELEAYLTEGWLKGRKMKWD